MQNSNYYLNKLFARLIVLLVFTFVLLTPLSADQFNAQKRYLYVQPGQDLFSIVKVLYPNRKAEWPNIIKYIVRKNPHAFVGADASRIQAGARIELPSASARLQPVQSSKARIYKGSKSVGQVIKSRGKVFVINKKNRKRNLQVGSEVFVGDRLFTGARAFLRLSMIDDAKIDLRCNSEMLIEDYQLLRGNNRSVLHLIKGSLNKVTGSIGKMADDLYEMHTPLATVGVRGTEYAIRVLQSHGCDGSVDVNSRGMFVKVNRGAINIKSQQQDRDMKQGEMAHLANSDAKLKSIRAEDAVFNGNPPDQKATLFGSVFWLILFAPLLLLLRRYSR